MADIFLFIQELQFVYATSITFSVNALFAMIAIAFRLRAHRFVHHIIQVFKNWTIFVLTILSNDTSTKFYTRLKYHPCLNMKPTTASNFVLAPWGHYEKWFACFKTSLTHLNSWMLGFKFYVRFSLFFPTLGLHDRCRFLQPLFCELCLSCYQWVWKCQDSTRNRTRACGVQRGWNLIVFVFQ